MTDDAAGSLATHRLRTTANLVGWAAAGALVSAAVWFLGGLVPVLGSSPSWWAHTSPVASSGITSKRWPGWVAAAAAGAWSLWLAGSSSASEDRWPFVGMLFISLLISVTTARYRWRLRPKALSGSPSR